MKQPEQGGSYIYDPDKETLTKVENADRDQQSVKEPDTAQTEPQPPAGPARKR
nr:hypothetical protein [Agrobacterium rosae]